MAKTTESADKYKRMKPTINIKTEGFLKKFFIDKQVKQIQVADKIGITRASLGGILSRNGKISIDSFATIADVIGCDMKIVLTDRETGQQWTCDETTRPKAHDENEITEIPEHLEEDQAENTASAPVNKNSREFIEGMFAEMSKQTEQKKKK